VIHNLVAQMLPGQLREQPCEILREGVHLRREQGCGARHQLRTQQNFGHFKDIKSDFPAVLRC